MNSSQMDWEHIGTTRIEQFVEQADAEAHDDKHNDKQKKMEAKEVVTTMVSSAPAAAREAISNLEEEDEGKANIKESEVKSAAAAAHKSEKTARVRPSVLRVLAVFVVTILALGVLALGMVVQKSRRSEALDAVDQLRTRVEALEQAAADLQLAYLNMPDALELSKRASDWLNELARRNMFDMVVTLDVSQ